MLLKKALIASMSLALLPAAAFAQSPPVHSAEIFHGQISLTQDSAFDLVVHLDRPSLAGEPVADQAFVFRSEVPLPTDLENLDGSAKVIVRPGAVLIFAEGHPAVVLRTGPAELVPSAASDGLVLNGYQLSRFQSTSEDYLDRAIERPQPDRPTRSFRPHADSELRKSFGAFLAVDEEDCTSGGPGAESCEISSPAGECDATCNEGYDACCNDGSCSCEAAS